MEKEKIFYGIMILMLLTMIISIIGLEVSSELGYFSTSNEISCEGGIVSDANTITYNHTILEECGLGGMSYSIKGMTTRYKAEIK